VGIQLPGKTDCIEFVSKKLSIQTGKEMNPLLNFMKNGKADG
jgi:hypothetical protein